MRAERTLNLQAIDEFLAPSIPWATLGRSSASVAGRTFLWILRFRLNVADVFDGLVQRGRHELMHLCRVVSLHKVRRPTATAQKLLQLFMIDTRQDGRIADFEAVEMKNWEHGAIRHGIEKLCWSAMRSPGTPFPPRRPR